MKKESYILSKFMRVFIVVAISVKASRLQDADKDKEEGGIGPVALIKGVYDTLKLAVQFIEEVQFRKSNISQSLEDHLESIGPRHAANLHDGGLEAVLQYSDEATLNYMRSNWARVKAYNALLGRLVKACNDERRREQHNPDPAIHFSPEEVALLGDLTRYSEDLTGKVKDLRTEYVCPGMANEFGRQTSQAMKEFESSFNPVLGPQSALFLVAQKQFFYELDMVTAEEKKTFYSETLKKCFPDPELAERRVFLLDWWEEDRKDLLLSAQESEALEVLLHRLEAAHDLLKELIEECPNGGWAKGHTINGKEGLLERGVYDTANCIGYHRASLDKAWRWAKLDQWNPMNLIAKGIHRLAKWTEMGEETQQGILDTLGFVDDLSTYHSAMSAASLAEPAFVQAIALAMLRLAQQLRIKEQCMRAATDLRHRMLS